MKDYSDIELIKLYNNYIKIYKDSYSEYEQIDLKVNFVFKNYRRCFLLYHVLDMYDDGENPYIEFVNLAEKLFGLDKNILEVGCGIYPAIGEEIAKRQNIISKGSITVYDPVISNKVKLDNIELKRKCFDLNTCISKYDYVISKNPCNVTMDLIKSCNINKKPLILSPCDCYNLLPMKYGNDGDLVKKWYKYVKMMMESLGDNVDTYYLDIKTKYECPIYVKTLKKID